MCKELIGIGKKIKAGEHYAPQYVRPSLCTTVEKTKGVSRESHMT